MKTEVYLINLLKRYEGFGKAQKFASPINSCSAPSRKDPQYIPSEMI